MQRVTLKIEGMSCGHCVSAVAGGLQALPGVAVERVDVGSARVRFLPEAVSTGRLVDAVEEEGYRVVGVEQG